MTIRAIKNSGNFSAKHTRDTYISKIYIYQVPYMYLKLCEVFKLQCKERVTGPFPQAHIQTRLIK